MRYLIIFCIAVLFSAQAKALSTQSAYDLCIVWEQEGFNLSTDKPHSFACMAVLDVWGGAASRNCYEAKATGVKPQIRSRPQGSFGAFENVSRRNLAKSIIAFVEKMPNAAQYGLSQLGEIIAAREGFECSSY